MRPQTFHFAFEFLVVFHASMRRQRHVANQRGLFRLAEFFVNLHQVLANIWLLRDIPGSLYVALRRGCVPGAEFNPA